MDTQLTQLADRLKQQARDRIMAFWLAHGIDADYGGYWTDLARDGRRYGAGDKWIIVQTRTIYSMCLAYQFFGEQEFLDQAAQGVEFFRHHFRDEVHGGWVHGVSRDGAQVLDDSKQPYGLAFVSYGLAEYARLTGDDAVLRDAADTHELVMERCWDQEHGGLPNKFSADWQLVEPIKRVDTHMHTMEGVSALYHATGETRYLTRLNLLADTILGQIDATGCYDAENGCTHEMFHLDWREALERTDGLVNYGHVTEAGWFIAKLAAFTGNARHAELARSLIDWAIAHGVDRARGGLFDLGRPTGEVVRDTKTWWNQAELLSALAFLYRTSGESHYLETLRLQIDFIEEHQLDREHGEWYPQLAADNSVITDHKGNRWKSPYHVMQGLYHAYCELRRAAGVESVAEPPQWSEVCL